MNNWLAGECLSHGKGRGPRGSKLHHTTASTLSAHDICKPYWRKSHIWALAEWGNCRPWRERKNCNSGSIITEGEMERGVRVRETRKQILSFRSSLTHSQANEELILVMFNWWRFWESHHNLFWRILANNMVVTLGVIVSFWQQLSFPYTGMKFFLSSVGETFFSGGLWISICH